MWNLLQWLYPGMTEFDCELMDLSQGDGPQIVYWNSDKLGPQPTQEYLDERLGEYQFDSYVKLRISELFIERDLRIDNTVGTKNQRNKNRIMQRQIKLLYKKIKDTTSLVEEQELIDMEILGDSLDAIDSACDSIEIWLEGPERSLKELEVYDVSIDPLWPE